MLLNGIFPAIPTPFYADGSLYLKKLEHNVNRHTKAPIAGVLILGSTGEAVFLSAEERREVLRTAIRAAAPEKVMIAGCGHESVRQTLEACDFAASLGYDAALVGTPHYYRAQMTPPAMLNYYRTVADRSPLPVLLHSLPQYTGYDLPVELIFELASHGNIIGLKESSADLAKVEHIVQRTRHIRRQVRTTHDFQALTARMIRQHQRLAAQPVAGELVPAGALTATAANSSVHHSAPPLSSAIEQIGTLRTRQREVGFQLLAGSGHNLHTLLAAGAVGGVLAFASCAPTACYEIYAAFKDNDQKLAAEKQKRIAAACLHIVSELGIAGVKYASDLNGFYGGNPRLPLLPLTASQRQEVERLMAEIKS